MKTVLNGGTVGVVVQVKFDGAEERPDPVSVHAFLKQFHLDDEGHVCLTSAAGVHGFLDAIEALRADLDAVANQAVFWVAESVASRRGRFALVANDG